MSDVPKTYYIDDQGKCEFCGDPITQEDVTFECVECGSGVHNECIVNNTCPWCWSWNTGESFDG